jgi:hypothetical protein
MHMKCIVYKARVRVRGAVKDGDMTIDLRNERHGMTINHVYVDMI